jgi:transposase-like protein
MLRNCTKSLPRLSWKWRERSAVKITERTREKTRKHYTAEEKVAILRRHLLEQEPVSKLCDEFGLQPTVFYRWQKEFFENGAAAFQAKPRSGHQAEQERIEYLEKKIQRKDEVLAEVMGEHIALKKSLGEL